MIYKIRLNIKVLIILTTILSWGVTGCSLEVYDTFRSGYTESADIRRELQELQESSLGLLSYRELSRESDERWADGKVVLPVAVITDHSASDAGLPQILLTGGTHGDEPVSTAMAMMFIRWLTGKDPDARSLREQFEFHVIPVINPQGLDRVTRTNPAGVDLNRNFEWAWQPYGTLHGAAAADQPETQLLIEYCKENRFVLALNGHAGAANITGLWDYIGTSASGGTPSGYDESHFISDYMPAYELIRVAGLEYARQVGSAPAAARYNDSELTRFYYTEGYDWYPVYGSFSDWLYGTRGTLAFTLEYCSLKASQELSLSDLSLIWEAHLPAMISLFHRGTSGIRGRVLEAGSGKPLSVRIEAHALAGERGADPVEYDPFCFTDPGTGEFTLPLSQGRWQIEVHSSDGLILESWIDDPAQNSFRNISCSLTR